MSSLLQIRDVPDEERRKLKARAAERGQSLNGYLLEVLAREVSRPSAGDVITRARQRAERSAISAVDVMREARESREADRGSRSAR